MTAALSAALVAGVAGGTAAAAAGNRQAAADVSGIAAGRHDTATMPTATMPALPPAGTTAIPGAANPGSTTPGAANPRATTPGTANPRATTPGAADPSATTPGAADPGAANPSATSPAVATPAATTPTAASTTPAHDFAPAGTEPHALDPRPGMPAARTAVAVRQKARPRPPRPAPVARPAAWVHPLASAQVTSCFGPRWGRAHQGVDLAAPHGTPVVAAGAGIVVRTGAAGGYGNAVLIDHGNGYLTHYGHLATITVVAGQRVAAGQLLGGEGSTGHSTGPHLHFEVHHGHFPNPVEPTAWMRARNVAIPGCLQ